MTVTLQQRLTSAIKVIGPFLLIAVAYLVAATREIELPGIYMDAVNPDYLVARWLNPDAQQIPAWVAPGNDILGRYPLLVGLHHGSLQLWLGAPLFWIFGMSVVGLRLTHAMFALAVLAAWYALQRQCGLSRTWAAAFAVALAIDPSFVYAFRDQCYITMAPVALLMLAVTAIFRAGYSSGRIRIRWLAASGLLAGLACWGYFVYGFFVPALLVAAWLLPSKPAGGLARPARILAFGSGLAAGMAPYAVGFLLLARQMGGFRQGVDYYLSVQPRLGVTDAGVTLVQQLTHVQEMLHAAIANIWHHAMMFGVWEPTPGADYKLFLLTALPVLLWMLAEWQRCATPLLRVVVGLQVSFICTAMFFGLRTNAHHYMPIVPLAYAGLAAAFAAFGGARSQWRKPAAATAAIVIAALLAINVVGNMREISELRRTGGVANFSDAINRLGNDLYEGDHNRLLVLPDWGLYMPTAFLTRASMEMASTEDFDLARRRLCEGKDVSVALLTGDRAERFRQWQDRLDWTGPQIKGYRQRDGKLIFELATFSGDDAGGRCHHAP
jgi:hypothetical protein